MSHTSLGRTPLSALVLTRNEEHCIARCLESLTWVDDIVVIDALSTDRTREICRDPLAPWASRIRLFERPWEGFRVARNFALDQARHEWVLVVDADERCTPELAARIQSVLRSNDPTQPSAYKIQRYEYFLGKRIRYGIWNPSFQDRFFRREGVRYINDIHEYPGFAAPPGRIEEALEHWPDFAPERFLHKMNLYTTIEARDRVAQGRRTNVFRLVLAFPAMFLKNYFYYSAWRDGMHGVVISLLEGLSRVVRHVKIWQFQTQPTLPKSGSDRADSIR